MSVRDPSDPFDLREIDIERDPALHARFVERIPVVEVDGEHVAELYLDPQTLREALVRARTGTVRSVTEGALEEPR
jgi:Glutaredoxin-like domain (DUF836)